MMAHENLTTRDESVKRGGGSVADLEAIQLHTDIQVPFSQLCR